jgi:hypothetical protein
MCRNVPPSVGLPCDVLVLTASVSVLEVSPQRARYELRTVRRSVSHANARLRISSAITWRNQNHHQASNEVILCCWSCFVISPHWKSYRFGSPVVVKGIAVRETCVWGRRSSRRENEAALLPSAGGRKGQVAPPYRLPAFPPSPAKPRCGDKVRLLRDRSGATSQLCPQPEPNAFSRRMQSIRLPPSPCHGATMSASAPQRRAPPPCSFALVARGICSYGKFVRHCPFVQRRVLMRCWAAPRPRAGFDRAVGDGKGRGVAVWATLRAYSHRR